jgi:serine protease Do
MRLLGVGCAVAAAVACSNGRSQAQDVRLPQAPASAQADSSRATAITRAVARVSPSVVTVQTQAVEQVPTDFFGTTVAQPVAGLGSGFFIRQDGVVLTNAHVVSGATQVSVALRDGTTYSAKVLGSDPVNDLAVLKVNATGLPVAPLGNSSSLLIGEWAIAIGNPYGFVLANTEPSVTVGVISATGRNLIAQAQGGGAYVDMIQTDAAINPGNSGGPLVDALGEVVGVNSSIYSPSGGSVGLGFAIPINRALRVAEDLLAHGTVRRPWVGIKPAVTQPGQPGVRPVRGAVVASVTPGSPAAAAGIQRGDVIVQAGDRQVRNAYDWEAALLELHVGDTVPITVDRGGRSVRFTVRVADLPEVSAPSVTALRAIDLVTLTPAIAAEHGIQVSSGAYVQGVSPQVNAQIGLEQGDVIVQINRMRVTSAQDAAQALNSVHGLVVMYVLRAGQLYSTEFVIQ